MNLLLRIWIVLSLAFTMTFASSVIADSVASESSNAVSPPQGATGSLTAPTGPRVDFKVEELETSQQVAESLDSALALPSDMTIVSSDEEDVLARASSSPVTLIPIGKAIRKAADLPGGMNRALRNSGLYLAQAYKKDKIGFSIATFTLGTEIVRWVHVSTASNFVITSNIVYAILWSAVFVDKDTWSRVTKPIQHTYRRLFGLSQVIPDHPTGQDIAMKFLAGLSLSMILNSGRAAIVGIDQLAQHVFDPLKLSMPYIMGIVMTAVGFSWSELIGHMDEKVYPRAKRITRLVMNSRSVLVAYFAASAMLMNPEHYGITPWLTVTISGVTGLVLYSNMKKWISALEVAPFPFIAPSCRTLFQ